MASQPGKLIRMKWKFERYANVEVLEFVYTVMCQTEEDLMKVEKPNRPTMFRNDETAMADV